MGKEVKMNVLSNERVRVAGLSRTYQFVVPGLFNAGFSLAVRNRMTAKSECPLD